MCPVCVREAPVVDPPHCQIRVLLTRILEEKENKVKEGMKMMGLTDTVYWLSWIVTSLIKTGFVTLCIVVVAKVGKLFASSDFLILLIFFILFTLIIIVFSILISTLFSKSRTGGAVGMLFFIILSTPSYGLYNAGVSKGLQLLSCLLAPIAFDFGALILNDAESGSVGVHWSNINDPLAAPKVKLGLGAVMAMLVLDIFLYSLLAWYLNNVVKNEVRWPPVRCECPLPSPPPCPPSTVRNYPEALVLLHAVVLAPVVWPCGHGGAPPSPCRHPR